MKKKNEQVEPINDLIKALKARHKIQVKIIRCDNAGEDKVLERESDKDELGIIFEYTAPGTLQQNGVEERAFVMVMGRARVVADTHYKVWRTKIDPRGKISLFVGYSTQHARDVYRLLNPKTSRVIHSRDVKWIGKIWAVFYKIKK